MCSFGFGAFYRQAPPTEFQWRNPSTPLEERVEERRPFDPHKIEMARKSSLLTNPCRFPAISVIQITGGGCLSSDIVNISHKEAWFESLYRLRAAQLLLYGRALGLSHAEAEDVLQETFIALMQREAAPAQPEHYCLRAYRNRALNYRRSLWRRITREFESIHWFEKSEDHSPAEREAMRRLADLPQDQREVIVLKIWHEYTFEQIGEILDVSPNTAAGRYRYGLQKLRNHLKGVDYERDERIGSTIALLATAPSLVEN